MARSAKCRRVCSEPVSCVFSPEQPADKRVEIPVEALEALRLCDLEGLDQDSAANRMGVSRGTLQRILYQARRDVADALVGGKQIVIGGGNYQLATGHCQCESNCRQCRFVKQKNKGDGACE